MTQSDRVLNKGTGLKNDPAFLGFSSFWKSLRKANVFSGRQFVFTQSYDPAQKSFTANIYRVTRSRSCLPFPNCRLGVIASEIENGTCLNNCPRLAWPPPGLGWSGPGGKVPSGVPVKILISHPNWDKMPYQTMVRVVQGHSTMV